MNFLDYLFGIWAPRMDIVSLLPEELAMEILQYCSPKELDNCSLVSKPWYQLARDESLWKQHCEVVGDVRDSSNTACTLSFRYIVHLVKKLMGKQYYFVTKCKIGADLILCEDNCFCVTKALQGNHNLKRKKFITGRFRGGFDIVSEEVVLVLRGEKTWIANFSRHGTFTTAEIDLTQKLVAQIPKEVGSEEHKRLVESNKEWQRMVLPLADLQHETSDKLKELDWGDSEQLFVHAAMITA